MKISIDLDTADATDLAALTALVRSLGGNPAEALRDIATEVATQVGLTVDHEKFDEAAAYCEEMVPAPEHIANPEGAPDVDSRGLPWDERIHAGTKATNADGSWRNKRGVDKALLDAVEAELRAGVPDAPSAPELPEPPVPNAPEVVEVPSAPAEPAAPIPDVPAPAAPTDGNPPSFKDAMARVTAGQRDGTVTQQQVAEAAQALGLSSVVDLAKPANAHLIEGFIAALG